MYTFLTQRTMDDSGNVQNSSVNVKILTGPTKWRLQLSTYFYFKPDAEARKCGEQTGLETRVVHTLNYGYSILKLYLSGL